MEAIILAGGLGTRLQSVVTNLPKAMAAIAGEPFLNYQLRILSGQGITKVILAVGYKHEDIINHYGNQYQGIAIEYSIEKEPLGTGGAILNALKMCNTEHILVVNGDTMMMCNIHDMLQYHIIKRSTITICLKHLQNYDRYGTVYIDANCQICRFEEKKYQSSGYINTGVYFIERSWLQGLCQQSKFSFERDILEKHVQQFPFYGYIANDYFLDIGIPDDFLKAQTDFAYLFTNLKVHDTLFLDRDGVINKRIPDNYVKTWEEFEFLSGSLEALRIFSTIFKYIIVVTNQQGIGKGVMTVGNLESIHQNMVKVAAAHHGRIDSVLFASDLAGDDNILRKPKIGMALQAKKQFADIDFRRSVMIGDSASDIQFGNNIGAYTIKIGKIYDKNADKTFCTLLDAARFIQLFFASSLNNLTK